MRRTLGGQGSVMMHMPALGGRYLRHYKTCAEAQQGWVKVDRCLTRTNRWALRVTRRLRGVFPVSSEHVDAVCFRPAWLSWVDSLFGPCYCFIPLSFECSIPEYT
jgi:hypothetical protein